MPSILMLKIIGVALLCGALVFACVRRDAGIREEGRQEVLVQAAATAEANRIAAAEASAKLAAEHAKTEAMLRRRVAAIRAAQADACSEANALTTVLEGLK